METVKITPHNLNRRVFVKGVGYVTLGLLMGATMGGCESCREQIQNRPIRRRLRTGNAAVDADIQTYKDAVTAMKALPGSDPRSWTAQAAIHGTAGVGFNFCHHGTQHFFSWHRAYLFYFEKICQELTGNKDWGLPYWNWNQNPAIHAEYLNNASPLFSSRNNTTMGNHSAVSNNSLDNILIDTNFFSYSSQIEGTPHNNVHGYIGGAFGGFGSAMDPIFYNHHCMVDYCWSKWNIDMGNDNTNDQTWLQTSWNHFVDGQGNPAETTAGLTTIMPLLSYQYECSNIGSNVSCLIIKTKAEFQKLEARLRKGRDIKFDIRKRFPITEKMEISLGRPSSNDLKLDRGDLDAIISNDIDKEFVFASIDFTRLPKNADFFVRVFINLPEANGETPTEDPHYAGSFAFFGTEMEHREGHHDGGQHGSHQPKFLVNLSPALQQLRRRDLLKPDGGISIQLVPVPFPGSKVNPEDTLVMDNLALILTPVMVKVQAEQ